MIKVVDPGWQLSDDARGDRRNHRRGLRLDPAVGPPGRAIACASERQPSVGARQVQALRRSRGTRHPRQHRKRSGREPRVQAEVRPHGNSKITSDHVLIGEVRAVQPPPTISRQVEASRARVVADLASGGITDPATQQSVRPRGCGRAVPLPGPEHKNDVERPRCGCVHCDSKQVGKAWGEPYADEQGLWRVKTLQRGDVAGAGGDVDERYAVSRDLHWQGETLQSGCVDHNVHIRKRTSERAAGTLTRIDHAVGTCGIATCGLRNVAGRPQLCDDPRAYQRLGRTFACLQAETAANGTDVVPSG